jgi:hypothetical protein
VVDEGKEEEPVSKQVLFKHVAAAESVTCGMGPFGTIITLNLTNSLKFTRNRNPKKNKNFSQPKTVTT